MARPPKYKTIEDLQADINKYFKECDETIIIKQHATSKGITEIPTPKPYTMAGLARALDMSRETLNQYSKKNKFSDAITHARALIHEQNITLALIGCHDSKIAALNLATNYGYNSKAEVSGTVSVEDKLAKIRDKASR